MSDYIIVNGHGPDSLTPSDVGPKAFRLIELGMWSRAASTFQVPAFAMVPAQLSLEYYSRFGAPRQQDYGPIAEPSLISSEVKRFFDGFYDMNAATFDRCLSYLSGPRAIYIGSSLALATATRISFAGVNSRTTPNSVPRTSSYVKVAVENALSGLFRAYAQLYLKGHGLAVETRPASIMFYEFIEAEYEAVAYVHGGRVHVEWKPLKGQTRSLVPPTQFDLWGKNAWGGYWNVDSRGERVCSALRDVLSLAHSRDDDIAEFEFCFTENDDLFILQYRSYPARFPSPSGAEKEEKVPILGTVGRVVGRPLSLVNREVSLAAASWIVDMQSEDASILPIWIVNRHGSGWDAFRLLWAADYANIGPIRLVMCHTHDFYPLHLTSVLREDPRVNFFGELELARIQPWLSGDRLELEGDGLNVWGALR